MSQSLLRAEQSDTDRETTDNYSQSMLFYFIIADRNYKNNKSLYTDYLLYIGHRVSAIYIVFSIKTTSLLLPTLRLANCLLYTLERMKIQRELYPKY